MKRAGSICALALVAACSPPIPDSGATDDYLLSGKAKAEAEAQAAASVTAPNPQAVSDETRATLAATAPQTTTSGQAIAAAPIATTAVAQPSEPSVVNGVQMQDGVVQASPSNPAPQIVDNPGISDENDFAAVDARRSIEDDAARRERNRANYEQVTPTALPDRVNSGPNVVAYALATTHPVGTKVHTRMGINAQARFERNCAKYASDDLAQIAFLERGGPSRDPQGLDPDGDGFACGWDPRPFRAASGG